MNGPCEAPWKLYSRSHLHSATSSVILIRHILKVTDSPKCRFPGYHLVSRRWLWVAVIPGWYIVSCTK
jgi:hypothetical protein